MNKLFVAKKQQILTQQVTWNLLLTIYYINL